MAVLICRNKSGVYSDQGNRWDVELPDSDPQMKSFPGSMDRFAQARRQIAAPSVVESIFCLCLTRRAGDNPWKQSGPLALELRGVWAELIVPREKPVALFGQKTWVAGELKQIKTTKSFTCCRTALAVPG